MLLKANEAAKLLAMRPARLYELARMKVIPSVKIGEKSIRFSESALEDWVKRGGIAQIDANGSGHEERAA